MGFGGDARMNKIMATPKGMLAIIEERVDETTLRRVRKNLEDGTGMTWQLVSGATYAEMQVTADLKAEMDKFTKALLDVRRELAKMTSK